MMNDSGDDVEQFSSLGHLDWSPLNITKVSIFRFRWESSRRNFHSKSSDLVYLVRGDQDLEFEDGNVTSP